MNLVKTTDGKSNEAYVLKGGIQEIKKLFNSLKSPDPNKWSVYFKAVKAGWIKPFTNPYFVKNPSVVEIPLLPSYNPMHLQLLRTMHKTEPLPFAIDWDQLERTPELLDYQENSQDYFFNPTCEPSIDDFYEIARFEVPPQKVGFVTNIKTSLSWWDYTNYRGFARGDANTNRNFNAFLDSGPLAEWHLRIESFKGINIEDNRILTALPGQAFNKKPSWRTMRFPWDNDNRVFWIIPANTILSLWCTKWEITPGQLQDWRQIAGLLAGATQPEGSKQTFENVTRAFR